MTSQHIVWVEDPEQSGLPPWRQQLERRHARAQLLRETLLAQGLQLRRATLGEVGFEPGQTLVFDHIDLALRCWTDPLEATLPRPTLLLVDSDTDELRALTVARPVDAVCRWPADTPAALALFLARLSRQQELTQQLHGSGSDRLTGLANRAHFLHKLGEALREGRRRDARALVVLDLDRFRAINEAKGASAGDALLSAVAHRLRGMARSDDLLARLGGDEFALLLQRERPHELPHAVEALLAAIAAPLLLPDGSQISPSCSAGLALLTPETNADAMLRRADLGCFDAKQLGGGRLVHHELISDDDPPDPQTDLRCFAELTQLHSDRLSRMVSELGQRLVESARQQALLDALTGLYNRRYFNERLPRDVERALRIGQPLAMAMVDLDDFGLINKQHGWATGDAALRQFAVQVRAGTRLVDWTARYGGEEFAIVLPDTDPTAALAVLERLRQVVQSLRLQAPDGTTLALSASIGLAWLQAGIDDAMSLAKAAGNACRSAKVSGKNRLLSYAA